MWKNQPTTDTFINNNSGIDNNDPSVIFEREDSIHRRRHHPQEQQQPQTIQFEDHSAGDFFGNSSTIPGNAQLLPPPVSLPPPPPITISQFNVNNNNEGSEWIESPQIYSTLSTTMDLFLLRNENVRQLCISFGNYITQNIFRNSNVQIESMWNSWATQLEYNGMYSPLARAYYISHSLLSP